MRYLSVCSGVEAASVAWHDLGWTPVGFSEIEPFPSAVLAHRFPAVKNYGDRTKYKEWDLEPGTVDVLVGGTPCQSFSVAGLRKGLDDPRGNLMLVYLGLAEHLRVPWLVWENVPGVLSSNGGRDFGTFLGALGELGYEFAWRVCDAQYWNLAQRRERVFLVGHLGGDRHPAKVLFESPSSDRNSREERPPSKVNAPSATDRALDAGRGYRMLGFGHYADDDRASTLKQRDYKDATDLVVTVEGKVRRLTPREHERLQGFPDDWTNIPWRGKPAPDGHRYKAMGNSFAVPVVRWIGQRLDAIARKQHG
jgi:DNA (cytosine-5)-methyltransferase 1